MAYCPLYKDNCPEDESKCELWMKEKQHHKCKSGGCEGQGYDCDVCGQLKEWTTGGCCSLKQSSKNH
jgi:hypothetical protein